jgi:hypothetical protein
MNVGVKAQLIQMLIPIGLLHVKKLLEEEVKQIAGERYKRSRLPVYDQWGSKGGSVYPLDQKLPIMVSGVREQGEGKEIRLRSYEQYWNLEKKSLKYVAPLSILI